MVLVIGGKMKPLNRLISHTTSVSLGTKGNGDQVSTDGHTGTGAATTGVDGEVVGAAALTTTGSETLGVVVRAHIRPLTQRTLAQQESTGLAHAVDDKGITGHDAAEQSPATSGSFHAVLGGNVVLDNEGNAVQGTADLALGTLLIQRLSNGVGIRVELQDGTAWDKVSSSPNDARLNNPIALTSDKAESGKYGQDSSPTTEHW